MSRSVHANRSRRLLAQRGCLDWTQIDKKRRIKSNLRRGHSTKANQSEVSDVGAVQVTVDKVDDVVFFPASVVDVKRVLEALPPGSIDGLRSVRLESGVQYVNQHAHPDDDVDPFLGRKGVQVLPGVYAPSIRGTYGVETADIRLFGYVKSTTLTLTARGQTDTRFAMLRTLVHEVAHHHDRMYRVNRGRWRMDEVEKVERFADGLTERWCLEIVTPYLAGIDANQK